MLYGIIGLLVVVIIFLIVKLRKKVELNKDKLTNLTQQVDAAAIQVDKLTFQKANLTKDIQEQTELLTNYNNKIIDIQNKYKNELNKKTEDLDLYFAHQKALRQSELDTDFECKEREQEKLLKAHYNELAREYAIKEENIKNNAEKTMAAALESQNNIINDTRLQQERFESLLEPLQQYEKEKQERLYYTIQVPDEYKDDIDFLLTTVSQKVQHPDVINKLVWAEYVKPYLDQTFKRVNIEDRAGIYKLTNLDSGKCYIGKSTNVKKRISDHFKSSIGIKSVADQAVHHAILKTGFWNWSIEVITYCEKEQLSELEKYYINFFKSQSFGYNKTGGG